jgi:hypothetical protein
MYGDFHAMNIAKLMNDGGKPVHGPGDSILDEIIEIRVLAITVSVNKRFPPRTFGDYL